MKNNMCFFLIFSLFCVLFSNKALGTPCNCPKPVDQWSLSVCDASLSKRYNSDLLDGTQWPYPHNESNNHGDCVLTAVPICDVVGSNIPVKISSTEMFQSLAVNSSNIYGILLREYSASKLNADSGPSMCSHPVNQQTQQVINRPISQGIKLTINLETDVMERARILLTIHCASQSFPINSEDELEASWLSSLLQGYNQGTLFSNETGCNMQGKLNVSTFDMMREGTFYCDASHNHSHTSLEWLERSCIEDHGHINKKNCPRWPGSTDEAPTTKETTFLCGSEETFSGVLKMDSDSETRDAWTSLGAQYVSALLNRQRGVCITNYVLDAVNQAKTILSAECPCSEIELLGQVGCNHTVPSGPNVEKVTNILRDYNSGLFSFGNGYYHHQDTSALSLLVDHLDGLECCSGGVGASCTRDYAYFLNHNCHVAHNNKKNRIAWPGGQDDNCATLPNLEDDVSYLCPNLGYTMYDILSFYDPSKPISKSDSWLMLAQAVIVTDLNINSGTCYKDVSTRYRDKTHPWTLWTLEKVIKESKKILKENCLAVGSVYHETQLGKQMHALRTVLNDYIRGNYGPGACYPNDMASACNNIQIDIKTKSSAHQIQTVTLNGGTTRADCSDGHLNGCCTKTAFYWAHN